MKRQKLAEQAEQAKQAEQLKELEEPRKQKQLAEQKALEILERARLKERNTKLGSDQDPNMAHFHGHRPLSTFESTKALHESEKAIKKAEKELQSIETERNTYIQVSRVINPVKLKTLTNRVTFATKQLESLQKLQK